MNEYWLDYPPIFSNIDWTDTTTNSIPTPEYEQKIPPFQRRRSSSVDLPINPLYLNSSRFTFGSSPIAEEETTFFSDKQSSKIGSSSVNILITLLIKKLVFIVIITRHWNFH